MSKTQGNIHKWSWIILIAFCIIGLVYPYIGAVALICMLAPVITAFFRGRMWCGHFCPRGSFNDIILSKISYRRVAPSFLKSVWFRNLFLVLLMSAFAIQLIFAWGSTLAVGRVFIRMVILTTILTIFLGIPFNQRTWCMICPMGTMSHYVAGINMLKTKFKYINFDKNNCINCKNCSKNCPMDIDVMSYKKQGSVLDSDCLKCGLCVEKCPQGALYNE